MIKLTNKYIEVGDSWWPEHVSHTRGRSWNNPANCNVKKRNIRLRDSLVKNCKRDKEGQKKGD